MSNLQIDTNRFTANAIELTVTEWTILQYLIDEDRVCSKEEILEHLYPEREIVARPLPNTIEVYVKYIRNKIGNDYIKTRRGFGYYVDVTGGK